MISRATLFTLLFAAPSSLAGAQAAQGAPASQAAVPAGPTIYYDYQVEKPVTASSKNKAPAYPKELRKSAIDGQVVVKFAVDSTGRAMLATVQIVRSDNDYFSKAVRDALADYKFTPAEIKGKKVNQFVQMPFMFSMGGRVTDTSTVARR